VKTVLKFAPAPVMLAMMAALCAQTPALAQTQKIATINMQQAVADLRSKFGPKDQDFQRRSQELQATQEKLRKTQNTISEEAKAKLEADIASMTRNLQRDSDDAKADMEAEEQKMVQDLGGKIMQVINKYAADNQYAMVFDVSGQPNNIMFASAAVDITRDIIAMYDKAAPGTPPAAPKPAPSTQKPATPAAAAPKPAGPAAPKP
jgi:outer membrane protein